VAYVSGNNLRVVTCLDAACTGTPSNNVAATSPPTGWTMSSPSIAALPNGNAVVSVAVNGDPFETAPAPFGRITLVNCANFSCAGPSTVTAVHNLSEISTANGSLVIAPDGFPWLTLARDSDQFWSILIDCKDTFCSQRDVSIIVVASALRMPQMSIGFDGTPLLSFWSLASSVGDGNALWFHGPRLQGDWVTGDSVAHTTTVDGRPIMFYENNGAMYSATCGDFDCTVFDPPVQVAAAGTVWPFRGPNGYPLLIHAGASGASVIECGSASCAS